ncbi:unnamed protein product [Cylicocyclus nassatus]|uniref:Uncharacterized protein n=1 Tax=Cylicocyclus nassatus TaxID=53992 RepID=A0AA36M6F2_CYLNA|nr:unnamed protein product [Cylicocyclus nassatus]
MPTCASNCRRNVDPSSDAQFPCRGFNFRPGKNPVCELIKMGNDTTNEPIQTKQLSFYFQKTCFRVPARCVESAFVFDVRRGHTLRSTSESRTAYSVEQCADICLAEECKAFVWDEANEKCRFFNTADRQDLERDVNFTYYENNCLGPESRCPIGRVEFLLVKHADVPSFGVSVGVKSIRNCMKECVDTTLFHCRSSQFNAVSSECFISDENSDVAVASANLDLYEAFCSTAAEGVANCNRPYSYEKLITSRLSDTPKVHELKNATVDACLSECSSSIRKCRSVNYDVSTKSCLLLSKARNDGAVLVQDDKYDYYEPACFDVDEKANALANQSYTLLEANRTLRQEYRNVQLLQTGNLFTCWSLCQNATSFFCHSFAYSATRLECVVSSKRVMLNENYEKFTQKSPIFDLYIRLDISEKVAVTTAKPRSEIPFPTLIHDSAISENNDIGEGSSTLAPTSLTTFTSARGSTASVKIDYFGRSSQSDSKFDPLFKFREPLGPNSSDELNLNAIIADPELQQLSDYEAIPRLALPSERIAFVNPDKVKVSAECHDTGINVSFHLDDGEQYTGAVYAAERFEQCRIFLRSSRSFAIFIPRPQHNTWCNALEIDKVVSAVIVMSNDRVLPHDVTTKDDLFFHVTCNYSTPILDKIRHGIVVGGPSPVSITSKELHRHVYLQIMKKGRPVDSVFIGEALIARVESDIPPERLRVMECTAHRVGGTGAPTSVSLITDGCALLPSLMAPMKVGPNGWESALSAFRIDGSEQIDIVCLVAVCPDDACPNVSMTCPPNKDRRSRSLAEKHPIRVDHRLIVKARAADSFQKDSRTFPEVCLQPTVYLSGLTLLALSLAALAVSLCVGAKRRSDSVEDLLSISQISTQQKNVGAKYVKTLSL